jgi:hypothetical protein
MIRIFLGMVQEKAREMIKRSEIEGEHPFYVRVKAVKIVVELFK